MKMELINPTINLPGCEPIAAYESLSHEQWLKYRTTGIGGSDAGGLLGMSQYSSPLSIWMDKTNRSIPDDLSDNEFVQMGNLLEPFIRRELVAPFIKEIMKLEVEVIDPTHMYRSIDNPFMIINTDGFLRVTIKDFIKTDKCPECGNNESLYKDELAEGYRVCSNADCKQEYYIDTDYGKLVGLEIKTGNSYVLSQWGGVSGDEIPDSYYCQVQHYMAGTGLDEFWVFGLIGNQRLLRIVPRNEEFISDMIQKEREFWELVQLNDPLYAPMPTGTDADMKALFELGEPQEETTMDLSGINEDIVNFLYYKGQIEILQDAVELAKQKIIATMATSRYGETFNHKATFSRFERSGFDKSRFIKDHPGMIDDYITTSETGRLSVKNI